MSGNDDAASPRSSYERGQLDESTVRPDPFEQFGAWLSDALAADIVEPHAMTVATVSAAGRPSARVVLLRGFDRRGFVFFTNYESAKGRELAAQPYAAAVFYWGVLERQLRFEGAVEQLPAAESDAYFAGRPRGHRLSAWASAQSSVVPGRAVLEARMAEYEQRFANRVVTRPPYWGGYRIVPGRFEFWQGRPDRLHDRIVYARIGDEWRIERLSP
jgi:pyridoxamine 5'-phosphate oxidase